MPMQPPPRRHDGSYTSIPPPMRPHSGYQPFYPQQMGPMMPQYSQPYAPNWYGYQQHHIHPMHGSRPPYYPQQPMPPPQYPPQLGPLIVSSQPPAQASPRLPHGPGPVPPPQAPSSASTTSTSLIQTPPSPPLSTSSTINTKKESISPAISPAPQTVQSPVVEAPREPFRPPVRKKLIPSLSFSQR